MASELAFVLINPYTIAKSRTGGVIARYVARTDLALVAARMFGPSRDLADEYAALVRRHARHESEVSHLIADYITRCYTPNPANGRPRRVMMLLFEGEDAIRKVWEVTGSATLRSDSGQTVRDTYGDYIVSASGQVQYFEPAVLVAPSRKRAGLTLRLWGRYSSRDGGLVAAATDVPEGEGVERTLVLLKPDNFQVPSARAGNIIDMLSLSGLRIIGVRKVSMSVAQAEDFYGPIRANLEDKFALIGGPRAARILADEFGFEVPAPTLDTLCRELGPLFAKTQFESIIKFMTGYTPSECSARNKGRLGREHCLALVYEGVNAVAKIRALLGPTDPHKARPGSVRREFGSSIMVNAAHASDSPESAEREIRIVRVEGDDVRPHIEKYYGGAVSRLLAWGRGMPGGHRRRPGTLRRIWTRRKPSIPE
ncbi:MAG: nucleoside-diphosphate kinase [Lentisphaerae bacterium]|nr:nucleoside-diphosphate kinase [Lentisphaerota bacterium]